MKNKRNEIFILNVANVQARELCASGLPIYVLVNPVEYHGPHLSLHNDRLLCEGLIPILHKALGIEGPMLRVDDLEVGAGPTPGPGTRDTPYQIVRELVLDTAKSLYDLGARKVIWLTFHGSPLHNIALQAGVDYLLQRGVAAIAPFHYVLQEMIDFKPERYKGTVAHLDKTSGQRLIDHLQWDFHAGFFETSLSLFLAPDSVSPAYKDLDACPAFEADPGYMRLSRVADAIGRKQLATELELAAVGVGWMALRPFPGYSGEPRYASAAAGKVFIDIFLDVALVAIQDALAGRGKQPRPIMTWLEKVTFGGRLFPPVPSVEETLGFQR